MVGQVVSRIENEIAHITLDDPATLNAVTMSMAEQLLEAFKVAQDSARAIILAGSGRAFCSGANLAGGAGLDSDGPDPAAPLITHFDPVIASIRDLCVPLITRVHGAATGYGAALALAGDIIIASQDAYFQQVFSRIGLVPDGGTPFTLVKAIGRVRATSVMLLGERIPAPLACEWGLITKTVPPERLDATVEAIASQLAKGPTLALGRTRQMAWAACSQDLADTFALEVANQRAMLATEDHRNALAAFAEKRRPTFSGR